MRSIDAIAKRMWHMGVTLLIGVPALLISWVLLGDYGAFFWDAGTFPCGIEAMLSTANPNAYLDPAYPGSCAGSRFQYMQAPGITKLLAGFVSIFGMNALIVLYGCVYAVSIATLGWSVARLNRTPPMLPLMFFLTLSCGIFVFEVASGNLSIVFAGLLTALILNIDRRPGLAVALCMTAAVFKPHYALYLLIPLVARRNYLAASFGAAGISLWYAADAMLHPEAFSRWLELIIPIVRGEPHFGFMRLMEAAGYAQDNWTLLAGTYIGWCAFLLALTLRVCARMSLPTDRAFAALACVTLMLPRLKEYDCLVLVPLFFWLAPRLADGTRQWLYRLVLFGSFVAPAAVWWIRKLPMLLEPSSVTLRAAAEIRWLLHTQGIFLVAAVAIVFGMMIIGLGRGAEATSPKPAAHGADDDAAVAPEPALAPLGAR